MHVLNDRRLFHVARSLGRCVLAAKKCRCTNREKGFQAAVPVNKSAHHPAQAQGTSNNEVCYWPSKHSMSRGGRDDLDNHLRGLGGEAQLKLHLLGASCLVTPASHD